MSDLPSWKRAGQVVVATVALAWMLLSPAVNQVFGVHDSAFRSWVMYRSSAVDICRVWYWTVDETGAAVPVDRYSALGYGSKWSAERGFRRVNSTAEATTIGRRICQQADLDDVRVTADCASREGWERALDGSENLCGRRQQMDRR